MKRSLLLGMFFTTSLITSYAQKTESRATLLKKYFLSLPYEKKIGEWIDEIANSPLVSLDSTRLTDSAQRIYLRGYANNWPVFEGLDSVKFYVGRIFGSTMTVNEALVSQSVDSFLYLRQIFYFSYKTLQEKQWKETTKRLLKEFKREFAAFYPGGGNLSSKTGELVWYNSPYGSPTQPVISIEYGDIEDRSIYYIILDLNFQTLSGG